MSTVQDAPIATAGPEATTTALAEVRPYLITAATFGRMLDAEVFPADDRVELWDGRIDAKMAKTQAHAVAANKTHITMIRRLPDGWFPGGENPVTIHQTRVPLPDLVVLRGRPDDYLDRRPAPGDVGLIVEFALSSLRDDTGARLAGFAAANIPVYWVLNLIDNVVLAFERPIPQEQRYELAQTYTINQTVPLRLDGVLVAEIPAIDLLPVRANEARRDNP